MLHLAICDDEKDFVTYLKGLLEQYAAESNENIKITVYYDGMELIERYDTTIDLIFLDIQMRLLNGLQAAERIRRMDEEVGIIFLTTLPQYGLEGYKYQAVNYIMKPMKYIRLKTELDQWLKKRRKDDNPALIISNDTGRYKVFLKSLRYVETAHRKLLLHTEQEDLICSKSMKEMEQKLQDGGFIRCHTSYIVNPFFIRGVSRLEIELITGELIPVSQPKRKEVMKKLTEYWGSFL